MRKNPFRISNCNALKFLGPFLTKSVGEKQVFFPHGTTGQLVVFDSGYDMFAIGFGYRRFLSKSNFANRLPLSFKRFNQLL